MSWKYEPTRTNSPLAPMDSAAASASEATLMEWLYVPGARRASSWSSGCAASPSSSKLISVCTSNNRSMNGSKPVMIKAAKHRAESVPHRAGQEMNHERRAGIAPAVHGQQVGAAP